MNLTTDDADGKIRLDQYLAAHLPELSRSRIQNLIKSGDVLVNGSPAKPKNPDVYKRQRLGGKLNRLK